MIKLPVDDFLSQIGSKITHNNIILTAEPGAGKTTRVPPFLLSVFTKKILVLVPRRVLAISAAHRIAEENSWSIGDEVGYQVRFESKINSNTRLIFMTEAILTRKLLSDPELKDVDLVILDEFHERSIHSDIALGLIHELQEMGRDIKLLVMSATIDSNKLNEYLKPAVLINVPGKLFPMEIQYSNKSISTNTGYEFIEKVSSQIITTLNHTTNDILVFLPGVSEINRIQNRLIEFKKNILILPLHGSLNLEEQKKALIKMGQQKIILATNLAESSLTVNGVDTVIDSGLVRKARFDLNTGFQRLETAKISLASATQRAGRSARQFPGKVIRLWTKTDELSLPKYDTPEILSSDLSETLLFLSNLGNINYEQFLWFEKPRQENIDFAKSFLKKIGAIDSLNNITSHGKELIKLPTHPRLAEILLLGKKYNCLELAARVASILSEKDPINENESSSSVSMNLECDIQLRLNFIDEERSLAYNKKINKSEENLLNFFGQKSSHIKKLNTNLLKKILLHSFPDRICRRREANSNKALMVGGRGISLVDTSLVKNSEFFIAIDGVESKSGTDTLAILATGIPKELLISEFNNEIRISENIFLKKDANKFYLSKYKSYYGLPLEEPNLSIPDPSDLKKMISQFLIDNFELILNENNSFGHFWVRWKLYKDLSNKKKGINVNFDFTQEKLKEIFNFVSTQVKSNNVMDYVHYDIKSLFESFIPEDIKKSFQKQIPERINFPNGKYALLQWSEERGPYVESKIQDFFGLKETPKIFYNEIPLTLVLLGPNYRPVQITKDLIYFWKNSYKDVRKELKARYPKHSWPEDPSI